MITKEDRKFIEDTRQWLKERRFGPKEFFVKYAKILEANVDDVFGFDSDLYSWGRDELVKLRKTMVKAMNKFHANHPDAQVKLSEFAQGVAEWLKQHDRKLTWLSKQAGLPRHKLYQYTSYSAVREVPEDIRQAVQKVMDAYDKPASAIISRGHFEYEQVQVDVYSALDKCREMDKDGWEVVAMCSYPQKPGTLCLLLKRPV